METTAASTIALHGQVPIKVVLVLHGRPVLLGSAHDQNHLLCLVLQEAHPFVLQLVGPADELERKARVGLGRTACHKEILPLALGPRAAFGHW